MAKNRNLKHSIAEVVKTNGVKGVTGANLQASLFQMIDKLGGGYQFGGQVEPTDTFPKDVNGNSLTDQNFAFLASTPGTYPNFGNLSVTDGQVALFMWDGSWTKQIVSYYGNVDVYGVRHFYDNASPELTRIGRQDLHASLPVQSLMRRCVVRDDGEIMYYLDAQDSTKKEDGTAAVLDGTDGQVMVEIPRHWRKCSLNTTGGYMDVEISLYPFTGAIPVHRYLVGAYEAALDRVNNKLASVVNNTAAFRGGNNTADWDGTYRSLLGLPATNISLTAFRTYGRNRGTGWGCYDWNAHLAIYWLFCIEYATLNSQNAFDSTLTEEGFHKGGLGPGVSNFSNWSTYNSYNPIIPCGFTNSLGNNTGVVTFTLTPEQAEAYGSEHSESVPSYRGIENPFGHIYKWTDGVLGKGVNDEYQEIYVSRDPAQYSSTINDSYVDMGHEATANGYCKAILASDPSHPQEQRVYGDIFDRDDSGSASTFFCDYHYHANANNSIYGLLVGGSAYIGASDGLAYLYASNAPAYAYAYIGSRLVWSE